jgi:uridine kinase
VTDPVGRDRTRPGDSVLEDVAGSIEALELGHPVRVGVDGITAAGKTTFANALGDRVAATSRPVIRLSMDGYHHPRAYRHRQGRESADGYYEDAYDFDAFATNVLEPLGANRTRMYRPAIIDLAADTTIDTAPIAAPDNTVLIVDGSFLARPEISALWDLRVFLDTTFDIARRRGAARDAGQFGSVELAEHTFAVRYHAANRRYLRELNPAGSADLVIVNDDPAHPRIRLRRGPA